MSNVRKFSIGVAALVACAILAPAAQAAWTVSSYSPPGNTSQAAGVSCTTASSCIAVGFQSGTTTRALATKYTGTFASQTLASTTSDLYGIGCNSATYCFAVGTDFASGAVPHSELYNGTTWTNKTVPNPAGATYAQLTSAACPSTTLCFGVGLYQTASATLPMLDSWNGTSWSQVTPTLPAGTTNGKLMDISCTSTSACTAVGNFKTASVTERTLVLRYNGTTWSVQSSANPSGTTNAQLQGVSCTTATACHAVGFYVDSSSVQHPLAEVWNGTLWTLKTVPDPAGGTAPTLYDVSCWTTPSAGCAAVGGYDNGLTVDPLAASWNGTSWALASVPKGAGVTDNTLTGVSCPTTCMAVGAATTASGVRPAIDFGP